MTEPASPAVRALHLALATAAEQCDAVAKTSKNTHHNYNYASAEDVLVTANAAMKGLGLAIVPQRSAIEKVGDLYILQREFLVTHTEGAVYLASMSWPLEINKGKTPDKAAAGAETTSFAYFLRTLFRMPRLAEDDINHDSHDRRSVSERFEESAPARPAVQPPAARKATKVLAALAALKTPAEWEKARDKWNGVLVERSPDDDCGYTADEVATINGALQAAHGRVGL